MIRAYTPRAVTIDGVTYTEQCQAVGVAGGVGSNVVPDAAEPAPPQLTHPTIARLVELSGSEPRAKLGFTDVSTFASFGVPAVNFGAGDPELAHHAGELVSDQDLLRCLDVLSRLLAG